MAGSINKVTLVGNLGMDPEVSTTPSGQKIVRFSVATSESWKDKNSGERQERTEWHNISVFNTALGDFAERYLKKGSKVYIEGTLQTRKYTDKNGVEKFATSVVLNPYRGELVSLDNRNSEGSMGSSSTGSWDAPASTSSTETFDDTIPF